MPKNETKITYDVYKSADICVAMDTSERCDKSEASAKKQAGLIWGHTVCEIMERIDVSVFVRDTSDDGIAVIGEHLKTIMAAHILAKGPIPEKGKNRSGKEFDVCGTDGIPKWGSWATTRRIWAYLGDIAKIIAYKKEAELYPETLHVAGRGTILAMCKTPEGHMKAIERLAGQLQDNLDMVTESTDIHTAHLKVAGLMVNNLDPVAEMRVLISKLDALLGVVEDKDRAAVLKDIGSLSKHF